MFVVQSCLSAVATASLLPLQVMETNNWMDAKCMSRELAHKCQGQQVKAKPPLSFQFSSHQWKQPLCKKKLALTCNKPLTASFFALWSEYISNRTSVLLLGLRTGFAYSTTLSVYAFEFASQPAKTSRTSCCCHCLLSLAHFPLALTKGGGVSIF